tara:strand:+ start:147 stop:461 length:315 start_codon:yes stop_codon:yes gene_type:complete
MSDDYNDSINPSHYTKGIDVQEFCYSHDRNGLATNVIKYIVRYDIKNPKDPLEDLYKCKQCLNKLIVLMEADLEIEQMTVEKMQKVINDQDKINVLQYFTKKDE